MEERKYWEFESIDFLSHGKSCIEGAYLLFRAQNRSETSYPIRILLVHGIELLLKSIIKKYDEKKLKEIKGKAQTRHNLKQLYLCALEIDKSKGLNILTQNNLKRALMSFTSQFYNDGVKARYNDTNSILDHTIFIILTELLIKPLETLIPPFATQKT